MCGGVNVFIQIFLTSALVVGDRSASSPQPLYCYVSSPQYHSIGDILHDVEKENS
jgi:hypothetical protein